MEDIFNLFDSCQYLRPENMQDFLCYSQFLRDALLDIDWRIRNGNLAMALRYLASLKAEAPLVHVISKGHKNPTSRPRTQNH